MAAGRKPLEARVASRDNRSPTPGGPEAPSGGDGPGPEPEDSGRPPSTPGQPTKATAWTWVPVAILVVAMFVLPIVFLHSSTAPPATSYPYSTFLTKVDHGQVKAVTVTPTGKVSGTLKSGQTFTTVVPVALGTPSLAALLQAKGVQLTATTASKTAWTSVLISLSPIILLVVIGLVLLRRNRTQAGGGRASMNNVGRSKAQVIDGQRPSTSFSDVAGYEGVKQEIAEVVDFLRHPARYEALGAVGPKGVLMVGPPGTGKTLLARAVAGEADVPFFSVAGSSFVEMFVGVGAARVRDLFAEARKRAPSIVFVDEIDAIGSRRGAQLTSNEERDQTLNQLLAEMDGFDRRSGVVVLAATNRPDVLDPALLRPGRFDRQVVVPLPTQGERRAILDVHARGKPLARGIDLDTTARATPGFSGADLANLLNEAAIFALRADRDTITAADLDEARDRILLGRRDAGNALLPEEKIAVAVHEAGHALVAALSPHADPVAKVTILPAGGALGVTEQLPLVERHLYSESYLVESLAVRLGGRAAELVVFGEGSTGAADDLSSATSLATRMVREFGLSPKLGPVGYGPSGENWAGSLDPRGHGYAEATQRRIDDEVRRLLSQAEASAVATLGEHRAALERLTNLLMDKETIDGDDVAACLRFPLDPGPVGTGVDLRVADAGPNRRARPSPSAGEGHDDAIHGGVGA